MSMKILFLAPALGMIAGCGEKIDAQESRQPSTTVASEPADTGDEPVQAEDGEVGLKFQKPVGLD